jgi:glucose-6-phosphate isomerase
MLSFQNLDALPAFARLRKLASNPYALTHGSAISPRRIASHICRAAGFDLLYAMQRVDEEILDQLQQLADQSQAVAKFLAMKKGAVLNCLEGHASENRQVLHTAARDLFQPTPLAPQAVAQAKEELNKLERFLADLDNGQIGNHRGEPFTEFIHIGIGGSDLGPRAVYLALKAFQLPGRRVHFISNVDPDDATAIIRGVDLSRTLVCVVSKSGTTLETLTNEELARDAFLKAGLDPRRHFLAVTGKGSPMDDPGRYLRSFYMFDYIGGRFSVTSMVGAVMLGYALGYAALLEFLRGAASMDQAVETEKLRENPALLLALLEIWNHNFLGCETVAVLPYSQALVRFTAHLQQLAMESNGKSINRQGEPLPYQSGPVIWGEPGTNGQHAFYQLIHQGTAIIPTEFIGFRYNQYKDDLIIKGTSSQEKLLANLLAQALALATGQPSDNPNRRFAGNRPSVVLMADRLTPLTMGALLALYEAKVVLQGFIWNINSFDQEGVQLGKKIADGLLVLLAEHRRRQKDNDGRDPVGLSLLKAAGVIHEEG